MDRVNWSLIVIFVVAVLSLQFGLWVAGRRWRRDPAYKHRSSCFGDTLSVLIGLVWIAVGVWLLFVGWNTFRQERARPADPDLTYTADVAGETLVTADVYATVLVYDASLGLDAPLPGATTSLCNWPTGDDGRTRCPWLVGPVPRAWWESFQDFQHTVTVTATAEGFQPASIVVYASGTEGPEFSIGLWPLAGTRPTDLSAGSDSLPPSQEVVASLYASILVYDAAGGPDAPIVGARTSLCDAETNRRGKASCPWLVAIVPADWWAANQGVVRPVTITVEATGFQPTTVISQAAVTEAPRFVVGLWPQGAVPLPVEGVETLVANGDFARGLAGWEIVESENCTRCSMEVETGDAARRHVLAWRRTQSGADGGALWAKQALHRSLDDCDRLLLALDVQVEQQSLSNSGWWSEERGGSGEYPAKVTIAFLDEQEERFDWSHGFLYKHDGQTSLTNYTQVPQGSWYSFRVDLLAPEGWVDGRGQPLPQPVAIQEITVGGNGWDFAGAIANVQLGCQASP